MRRHTTRGNVWLHRIAPQKHVVITAPDWSDEQVTNGRDFVGFGRNVQPRPARNGPPANGCDTWDFSAGR